MVKTYSLDDIGSRRDHLLDLQLLWSDALSILTTMLSGYGDNAPEADKIRKARVETALELLEIHLTKDFEFGAEYGKMIDGLPKDAQQIPNEKDQADGNI